MTREISIQGILAGMLKKWKMLLIVFIVFFLIAFAYFVHKAQGTAQTQNAAAKQTASAESASAANSKTVKTKAGLVLTVDELNRNIYYMQEKAKFYESYLNDSYRMNSVNDNDSVRTNTLDRIYVVDAPDKDGDYIRLLSERLAAAISDDLRSVDFENILKSNIEGLDTEFFYEIVSATGENGTVSVIVQYLDYDTESLIMKLVVDRIESKIPEYKSSLGDFSFTLLQEIKGTSISRDSANLQYDFITALNSLNTLISEYRQLALTVEDESQIGVIDVNTSFDASADETSAESTSKTGQDTNASVKLVTWKDTLSKKDIAISIAAGLVMAIIIGFIYTAYGTKKILSTYDVRDISGKDILIAKAGAKAKVFDKRAVKKCPQADDEMAYVRILKTVENLGSKRLIVDFGREEDADILAMIKENLSGKLEILASSDFSKRVDFVSAWTKDDACLVVSKIDKTLKKEMFETLSDYSEAGVELVGNIVLA